MDWLKSKWSELQSNQCLRVNDKKAFLEPCNSDSMRWGLNDMTRQIMEVQTIKCLEKHDAGHKWQLRLGPCNAEQESKHQKWKFEFYNPHYTNSTKLTRLMPITILDWHRNYSIYDIPFPPYPDIIRRKWNSQYDTLDEEISAFLIDQNSTEFDSLTPLETTTQNVAATTTLIANSSIYTQKEQERNQPESNQTEINTNVQENDRKSNIDENILITQSEDGEKSGISDEIDNLIVDEGSTTTTTTELPVSSTSTTSSTTSKTTSTTPIFNSTSPTTQNTNKMSSSAFSAIQETTTITPKTESTTLNTETTIPTNITVTSTTSETTSSTSTTTQKTKNPAAQQTCGPTPPPPPKQLNNNKPQNK